MLVEIFDGSSVNGSFISCWRIQASVAVISRGRNCCIYTAADNIIA